MEVRRMAEHARKLVTQSFASRGEEEGPPARGLLAAEWRNTRPVFRCTNSAGRSGHNGVADCPNTGDTAQCRTDRSRPRPARVRTAIVRLAGRVLGHSQGVGRA